MFKYNKTPLSTLINTKELDAAPDEFKRIGYELTFENVKRNKSDIRALFNGMTFRTACFKLSDQSCSVPLSELTYPVDKITFTDDVKDALQDEVNNYLDYIHNCRKNYSNATKIVKNVFADNPFERIEATKELYTNFFSSSDTYALNYTDEDRRFCFDHVYKDQTGNLYWRFSDDTVTRIDIVENTQFEIQHTADSIFWVKWQSDNQALIKSYFNKVHVILENIEDLPMGTSLEQHLLAQGVPHIILDMFQLTTIMGKTVTTDEKGHEHSSWITLAHDIALNLNGKQASYNVVNVQKAIAQYLLAPLDLSRVQTIKHFGNKNDANCVTRMPYDPDEPVEVCTMPATWERFLTEQNGKARFRQPKMALARIAFTVMSALDANYTGRQCTILAGDGQDGKGVFIEVLRRAIGTKYCVNVPVSAFDQNDRFGLKAIIDKKLVMLTDCKSTSNLLGTDKFKALTGGDVLDIDQKFKATINYNPQGTYCIIATNNCTYLKSEHGRSRVVPIVFLKNYDQNTYLDKTELEDMLVAEFKDFVKWCRYYLATLTKAHPMFYKKNALLICTDEAYDELDNMCDPTELFANAIKFELFEKGDTAFTLNQYDENVADAIESVDDLLQTYLRENIVNAGVNFMDRYYRFKPADLISWIRQEIAYGGVNADRWLTAGFSNNLTVKTWNKKEYGLQQWLTDKYGLVSSAKVKYFRQDLADKCKAAPVPKADEPTFVQQLAQPTLTSIKDLPPDEAKAKIEAANAQWAHRHTDAERILADETDNDFFRDVNSKFAQVAEASQSINF